MDAMPDAKALRNIGEAVDRLISVDVSARGLIGVLYDAARASLDGRPLALTAAERLWASTAAGQPVVVATGLPIRGWFSPAMSENDGPVGAATLARALYLARKALPVLICETEQVPVLRTAVRAAGLTPTTFEQVEAAAASPHAVPGRALPVAVVEGFPSDDREAVEATARLLGRQPAGLVSIERQGANAKGVYHYGRGEANRRDVMAKIDLLFEEARARGIPTIGIGDGGNELGMGRIKDAVRAHVPFGGRCACPCGAGMAPEMVPDILIAATVSNWGAWGIEACLAALSEDPDVMHSAAMELDVIHACTAAGAVDGATGFVEPFVDALPASVCASLVEVLHTIVRNGLNPPALFRTSTA
jgi:hypothetical protein